ncbi:hypothetical protein [Apilactobacillus bombintestini]|uniref:Uncharacterized protein n=1 Tax=Apilactobacillus bombintestini TaxID=2419772 RepID=A0A387AQ26_9LACO|nr:hypothetical protein [Apilactobacillus bombintestini]AYF92093.1 hypothetical protein D7I45_00615 [Apilactobacillus bombintestini]
MQYNKRKIRKINDKKVLKKVKRNWVVASISSFAFFGAIGFTLVSNHTEALADSYKNQPVVVGNSTNGN